MRRLTGSLIETGVPTLKSLPKVSSRLDYSSGVPDSLGPSTAPLDPP